MITRATIVLALLIPAALAAQPAIWFTNPHPGEPVFGTVDLAVEVEPADDVLRVEFFVDGEKAGEIGRAPFRIAVDLGEENREHHFEARCHSRSGEVGTTTLVTPSLRVDEKIEATLQQLYVTVLADEGRVLDLTRDDFEITDQGLRQEIVTFERGDVPLAAAVLIDSSASMRRRGLRFALRGAGVFSRNLRTKDELSIQLFADQLLYSSPFSGDRIVATAGLADVRAGGGTALVDHLYVALRQLEERQGRRVVVLLSDGIDSHSTLRMADVNWAARRSRAMIYWLRVGLADMAKSRFSAWKDSDIYRDEHRLLEEAVAGSGGRVVRLESIEEAEPAVAEVLAELRDQYVLGYYPSNAANDGRWRRVNVRVRPAKLTVRARGGYVDY